MKEVVALSQAFAHLQETEHPDLESFFDTEIDHTDNPNTNSWNIPRFSNIYASDFQLVSVANKSISNYLLMIEGSLYFCKLTLSKVYFQEKVKLHQLLTPKSQKQFITLV